MEDTIEAVKPAVSESVKTLSDAAAPAVSAVSPSVEVSFPHPAFSALSWKPVQAEIVIIYLLIATLWSVLCARADLLASCVAVVRLSEIILLRHYVTTVMDVYITPSIMFSQAVPSTYYTSFPFSIYILSLKL